MTAMNKLKKKVLLYLIIGIFPLFGFSQNKNSFSLEEKSIYIVARSTQTKEGLVASSFNIQNKVLSHVGIGYVEKNKLNVYNVSNYKTNNKGSSLLKETFEEFINEKGIIYYSIWKYKPNENTFNSFRTKLDEIGSTVQKFDNEFRLDNKDLYCSELVYNLLKELQLTSFLPQTRELGMMYSLALGRKTLKYIPVDFFLSEKKFKIVHEETLSN